MSVHKWFDIYVYGIYDTCTRMYVDVWNSRTRIFFVFFLSWNTSGETCFNANYTLLSFQLFGLPQVFNTWIFWIAGPPLSRPETWLFWWLIPLGSCHMPIHLLEVRRSELLIRFRGDGTTVSPPTNSIQIDIEKLAFPIWKTKTCFERKGKFF